MKTTLHTWTVPIYGDVVCWYTSRTIMDRDIKNLGGKTCEDITKLSWVMVDLEVDAGPFFMVGVFDKSVTTLAHECAHLAISILANHGIPVTTDNDEAFAYLLETCMKSFLAKHKVKK